MRKDRGRNLYDTTSPFETASGEAAGPTRPRKGNLNVSPRLIDAIAPATVAGQVNALRYDNPRGNPGLDLVSFGNKPRTAADTPIVATHSINSTGEDK